MIHSPDNYLTPSTVVHIEQFICYIYKIHVSESITCLPNLTSLYFHFHVIKQKRFKKISCKNYLKNYQYLQEENMTALDWQKTVVSKHLKLFTWIINQHLISQELLLRRNLLSMQCFQYGRTAGSDKLKPPVIFFSINMPIPDIHLNQEDRMAE